MHHFSPFTTVLHKVSAQIVKLFPYFLSSWIKARYTLPVLGGLSVTQVAIKLHRLSLCH